MDKLKVKLTRPGAHPPDRAKPGDLGYDLYSAENVTIPAGEMRKVHTGIAVEFPEGWGAMIRDRSSMAVKRITTSAGVIDHGYRGEIIVLLSNHSPVDYIIEAGHKIAQMIPAQVTDWVVEVSDDINETERGASGFGSSGHAKTG